MKNVVLLLFFMGVCGEVGAQSLKKETKQAARALCSCLEETSFHVFEDDVLIAFVKIASSDESTTESYILGLDKDLLNRFFAQAARLTETKDNYGFKECLGSSSFVKERELLMKFKAPSLGVTSDELIDMVINDMKKVSKRCENIGWILKNAPPAEISE